jgi:hypothetical protein
MGDISDIDSTTPVDVQAILSKYYISDIDDAGDPKYYGFLDKDGNWYILEETGGAAYRYIHGSANYAINWGNRGILVYNYFDVEF